MLANRARRKSTPGVPAQQRHDDAQPARGRPAPAVAHACAPRRGHVTHVNRLVSVGQHDVRSGPVRAGSHTAAWPVTMFTQCIARPSSIEVPTRTRSRHCEPIGVPLLAPAPAPAPAAMLRSQRARGTPSCDPGRSRSASLARTDQGCRRPHAPARRTRGPPARARPLAPAGSPPRAPQLAAQGRGAAPWRQCHARPVMHEKIAAHADRRMTN